MHGLGMNLVARSDMATGKLEKLLQFLFVSDELALVSFFPCVASSCFFFLGNKKYCSFAVQSNELVFVFTAAYGGNIDQSGSSEPHPAFHKEEYNKFIVGMFG
jgi:hypothetical protein